MERDVVSVQALPLDEAHHFQHALPRGNPQGADLLDDPVRISPRPVVQKLLYEIVAAVEVVVEAAFGHAQIARELVDAQLRLPLLGKDIERGGKPSLTMETRSRFPRSIQHVASWSKSIAGAFEIQYRDHKQGAKMYVRQ
ncbi:hypothetical protein AUC68_10730 [Methyloceanibacter methanicus]|uniref:Uncharacterized protein n=1 Tax=Methyloceanibacter methanicus TaxID=1774968 RepID=A0A1E3VWT3_9HYPH|nr:hypothetical protein AUC68_10730 [Methyloceanibacter methanicus]